MTFLRSEAQIRCGLRIITSAQIAAHSGRVSPLIHTTKESASLLVDQGIHPETLLARRYTIHGVETGIKPNSIFTRFIPLGMTLARYGESFGLFKVIEKRNQTTFIPLVKQPLDISSLVTDPKDLLLEAEFLGNLEFVEKNILATHRTLEMTAESHRTVSRLFLGFSERLLRVMDKHRVPSTLWLADKMNECADELVKKSSYYPAQAAVLKKKLGNSHDAMGISLGKLIEPHEELMADVIPLSNVVLRSSHLVRSLLSRMGLYTRPSASVHAQYKKFAEACKCVSVDPPRIANAKTDINTIIRFVQTGILTQLIWWNKGYGTT
jgi:hypothetical protein